MQDIYAKKISNTVIVARVFALISIVSAHITFGDNCPYVISKLYSSIASIGVVTFLIISGYYYNSAKFKNLLYMLKSKCVSIGLPWLFFGTFSFLYGSIMSKEPLSPIRYFKYLLGNGSYLYYLTVLIICFILFFRTNKVILFGSIALNLVSLVLTTTGVISPVIQALNITNYLNVFNWIGIFAIGVLLRSVEPKKIYDFLKKTRWIFASLFIVADILIIAFNIPTGYFSFIGIWQELLGALAIFGFSTISCLYKKVFVKISNYSFSVYLIHIVLNGIINDIYNKFVGFQIIAPFLIIVVCCIGFEFASYIISKVKFNKYLFKVLGFRTQKQ